eukprot:scaffold182998_cov28-Attheya_sp.AAC.1
MLETGDRDHSTKVLTLFFCQAGDAMILQSAAAPPAIERYVARFVALSNIVEALLTVRAGE